MSEVGKRHLLKQPISANVLVLSLIKSTLISVPFSTSPRLIYLCGYRFTALIVTATLNTMMSVPDPGSD